VTLTAQPPVGQPEAVISATPRYPTGGYEQGTITYSFTLDKWFNEGNQAQNAHSAALQCSAGRHIARVADATLGEGIRREDTVWSEWATLVIFSLIKKS
jgi:hypothetical protein